MDNLSTQTFALYGKTSNLNSAVLTSLLLCKLDNVLVLQCLVLIRS